MNQCIRLMEAFITFSNIRPVDEVKLASTGFISILGNLRSVECNSLLMLSYITLMIKNLTKTKRA